MLLTDFSFEVSFLGFLFVYLFVVVGFGFFLLTGLTYKDSGGGGGGEVLRRLSPT